MTDCTIVELRQFARQHNLTGYSKYRKNELLGFLRRNGVNTDKKKTTKKAVPAPKPKRFAKRTTAPVKAKRVAKRTARKKYDTDFLLDGAVDNVSTVTLTKHGYTVLGDLRPWSTNGQRRLAFTGGTAGSHAGFLVVTGGKVPRGEQGIAKMVDLDPGGEGGWLDERTAKEFAKLGIGAEVYDTIRFTVPEKSKRPPTESNTDAWHLKTGEKFVILILKRYTGSLFNLVPFTPAQTNEILPQVVDNYLNSMLQLKVQVHYVMPRSFLYEVINGEYRVKFGAASVTYQLSTANGRYNADSIKQHLWNDLMDEFMMQYHLMHDMRELQPSKANIEMVTKKLKKIVQSRYSVIDHFFASNK
jgi:hypothetical protein